MRLMGETNNIIEYNLERLQIEIGRNIAVEDIPNSEKYWNRTWLDHVFEICKSRNLNVERNTNFLSNITQNKAIMDYAVRYNNTAVTLGRINHVRLYKRLLLPCKVLGMAGDTPTSYYYQKYLAYGLKYFKI